MQVDSVRIIRIIPPEISRPSINNQIVIVRKLGVLRNSARLHRYTKGYAICPIRAEVRPILLPLVVASVGNTWICKGAVFEFGKVGGGVQDDGAFQAILQVGADAGKVDDDGDVEAFELGAGSDAAEFEELGSVESALVVLVIWADQWRI